jgi:pimeloyl-ACP methyl ester carboxylesterase
MASYVLIHGAWHGAWCWEKVQAFLLAQGHQVIAPDMPGHGSNQKPHHAVKFRDYIDCIISSVEACKQRPILVGHSFAGMFLSYVAANYPGKIEKFIYLSAYVPVSGESFFRISERLCETPLSEGIIVDKENSRLILNGDQVAHILYHCSNTEEQTAAISKLSPEPLTPFATPVNLPNFDYNAINAEYIFCKEDRALKFQDQQWMAERLQCKTSTLPSDHTPFISMPHELAQLLVE